MKITFHGGPKDGMETMAEIPGTIHFSDSRSLVDIDGRNHASDFNVRVAIYRRTAPDRMEFAGYQEQENRIEDTK